ncbi:hypothetical protein BJ165DRAFT_1401929 [Panaeolus papilionaceus]|nr:hypothetical protein BJ165DRAFT_1401929 [Panaeolus papilionaceus]
MNLKIAEKATGIAYRYNESVVKPNPPEIVGEYNYRFNKQDAVYTNFTKPQWWTKAYCWTAFTPLKQTHSGPFHVLDNIQVQHIKDEGRSVSGYGIPKERVQSWLDLEHKIYRLIESLRHQYPQTIRPHLPPMPTHYMSPSKIHKYKRAEGIEEQQNEESEETANNQQTRKPWYIRAIEDSVSSSFVNAFMASTFLKKAKKVRRAGVFINVLSPEPGFATIEWLVRWNVPVWYYWSNEEADAAASKKIAEFLVPLEAIINNIDVDGRNDTESEQDEQEGIRKARQERIAEKPWESFFQRRTSMEAAKAQRESDRARRSRLEREKRPPIKGSKYWQWTFASSTTTELRRIKLDARTVLELENRPSHQMKYYAWDDKWDVCSYFEGEDGGDDREDMEGNGVGWAEIDNDCMEDDTPAEPGEEKGMHKAYYDIYSRTDTGDEDEPDSMQLVRDSHGNLMFEATDINWVLRAYYGFKIPKNTQPWRSRPTEREWAEAMTTIGRTESTTTWVVTEGSAGAIIDFVHKLSKKKQPLDDMFDLGSNNGINIPLHSIRSNCFEDTPIDSWIVALYNPMDVLYVYRLLSTEGYVDSRDHLIQTLVMDGIRFQTLEEIIDDADPPCTLDNISTHIPIQLSGHKYLWNDYTSYIHMRARILLSPRGRAALLAGGIVSRIAMEHLDMQAPVFGPSTAVTKHSTGITIYTSSRRFVDDALTQDEMDLICGAE